MTAPQVIQAKLPSRPAPNKFQSLQSRSFLTPPRLGVGVSVQQQQPPGHLEIRGDRGKAGQRQSQSGLRVGSGEGRGRRGTLGSLTLRKLGGGQELGPQVQESNWLIINNSG